MAAAAPPPPKQLLEFLKPFDRSIQELALATRAFVLAELKPRHECIYDAYSAVSLGYGPTDRLKDGICHVAVYAKHVNIGFNKGSQLPDPDGALRGSGKWIRHITIRTAADLAQPSLRRLLRLARELGGVAEPVEKVTSAVKAVYANRRRPGPSK